MISTLIFNGAYSRKWTVKSEDVFLADPSNTDLVIALIGPTGSGKSTFINKLIGQEVAPVGHGMESKTERVRHFFLFDTDFPGRRIVLVDTPGFDDTFIDEREILRRVLMWLARSYNSNMKLAGLVCLQDITQNRMERTPGRNFDVFETLCGAKASSKVVFVTTMWNHTVQVAGERREKELRNHFWKDMLANGSSTIRFDNTQHSAKNIVQYLLTKSVFDPIEIQQEMLELNKLLPETEAARFLSSALQELLETRKAVTAGLERGKGGPDQRHELLAIEAKIGTILEQIKALNVPLPRRILRFFGSAEHDSLWAKELGSAELLSRAIERPEFKAAPNDHRQSIYRPESTVHPISEDVKESLDPRAQVKLVIRLRALFADRGEYKQLLECRGSNAQGLLDMFQRLLDVLEMPSESFRRDLIVATQRLAGASGFYPACYELNDVTAIGNYSESSGGFADIYKGIFHGRSVCLKAIRLNRMTEMQWFTEACSKEAILWGQLAHPNLLPFYGVYQFGGRTALVSPWMEDGDINNYLKHHGSADRVLLASEVAAALQFLHKNGIIHGDLKGPNVLVDESGRACVADFGISSISDPNILTWTSYSAVASKGGSVRWQAPELFDPDGDEDVQNTVHSDIYAWSCVAYEIFTGHVPFVHLSRDTAISLKVRKGERPVRPLSLSPSWIAWGLTENIWSLMQDCWKAEPSERPTVDEIIRRLRPNLLSHTCVDKPTNALSPIRFREMTRGRMAHDEMTVRSLERLLCISH